MGQNVRSMCCSCVCVVTQNFVIHTKLAAIKNLYLRTKIPCILALTCVSYYYWLYHHDSIVHFYIFSTCATGCVYKVQCYYTAAKATYSIISAVFLNLQDMNNISFWKEFQCSGWCFSDCS